MEQAALKGRPPRRVLGVDWGERRVGLAISDADQVLALPLRVEQCSSCDQALAIVERAVRELGVERVVVGHPVNMNGTRGKQARRAEEFAAKLRERIPVPVELWDERLSSRAVERALREGGIKARQQRGRVDQLAAQWILQGYLDCKGSPHQRRDQDTSPKS